MTKQQISEFIVDRLQNRKVYGLTISDQKLIERDGVAEFIFQRLVSGRYRKLKLENATKENVQDKVKTQVKNNEPIKLTFPFGGYKNHLMPSSPKVDWAEFFSVAYYADYMNQVVSQYQPGIVLELCSDEYVLKDLNNIPNEETEKYTESFNNLLSLFEKYLPENVKIKLSRVRDQYKTETEMIEELKNKQVATQGNWNDFDEDKKQGRISMVKLNYVFAEGHSWDEMSPQERELFMRENTALHDAYLSLSGRRNLVRGADKIVIFPFPINDSITLGSTKYSVAKFWSGYGAIKIEGDNIQDCVMSPDKLALTDFEEISVDGINLSGFDKIRVYGGQIE
jgi:hypothetical protein